MARHFVLGRVELRTPLGVSLRTELRDTVEAGQGICLLEAMKMENLVEAERAGVVAEVRVVAGDNVGAGDVLATLDQPNR